MTLIVEDGTGRAEAESYVSVADFKVYCDKRGLSYAGKSDDLIEQALRRATQWVDATYGDRFCGVRVHVAQALVLPQAGLVDRQGYYIASDAVPRQVVSATAEAGFRELQSPQSLSPDVTPGKVKKRVRVEGAVEVEYAVGAADAAGQAPVISVVNGILAPLFRATSVLSGRAVRG